MKAIITLLMAVMTFPTAYAYRFVYTFRDTPVSQALAQISKDHPELDINLIYQELENYRTSATIRTDDAYDALYRTIGLNPVTVIHKGDAFYIEALQHGKYHFTGRAAGPDDEPVAAATVLLLEPKDSTVVTYGITDSEGGFSIPCDSKDVIIKLTCTGYLTTYHRPEGFATGTIRMDRSAIKLNSVTVEADYAAAYTDRTVFVPTSRQKNSASDATQLLLRMAIPQITVDPVSKTVTTPSGAAVAVYIDYIEAQRQDMIGMLAKDVKRVEYFAFPTDPRFKRAPYVINFVMQKYAWGGYTRLGAEEWVSVNRTEANLYSKFAYKKMTFDVYADEIYLANDHGGSDLTEKFRFTDLYGQGPQEVTRRSYTEGYKFRTNSNDITLRAIYNSDATQLTNRINVAFNNTPHNDATDIVEYSADLLPVQKAERKVSSKDYAINYDCEFYRPFSEALSLQTDGSFVYGHNTLSNTYTTERLGIVNDAAENVFSAILAPRAELTVGNAHSISVAADGRWKRHAVDYFGNSPSRQVYTILIGVLGAGYDYTMRTLRIGTSLSWAWEHNNIGGFRITNSFPVFELRGVYTPTPKMQLQASVNLGRVVPEALNKSPNMLRQDELMWYTGSPDLKDNSTLASRGSYYWFPNNRWQVGLNGQYYQSTDRVSAVYLPEGPDGTMLRKYTNSGNFYCGMIGMNSTVNLFDRRLSVTLRPQYWLRKSTGVYRLTNRDFVTQATANYYFGKFNLFAYYCTPSKYIEEENGYIERTATRYMLSVGWHNGPWHADITAYNFFRTNWKTEHMTLTSKYFDYNRQDFNNGMHQRFSFSINYTFNYGKKINNRNETSGSGTAASAILK